MKINCKDTTYMFDLLTILEAFPEGYTSERFSYFCSENMETLIVSCRLTYEGELHTVVYDMRDTSFIECSDNFEDVAKAFLDELSDTYFLPSEQGRKVNPAEYVYFKAYGKYWLLESSKYTLLNLVRLPDVAEVLNGGDNLWIR